VSSGGKLNLKEYCMDAADLAPASAMSVQTSTDPVAQRAPERQAIDAKTMAQVWIELAQAVDVNHQAPKAPVFVIKDDVQAIVMEVPHHDGRQVRLQQRLSRLEHEATLCQHASACWLHQRLLFPLYSHTLALHTTHRQLASR
jgi:hypothetical protein